MKNSQSEFLSAFLDDEAGTFERRRMMDVLKQDSELAAQLSRYAFIKEAMRANQKVAVVAPRDFLQGIHAKIQEEELIDANHPIVTQQSNPANSTIAVPKQPWRQWMQYSIAAGFGAISMAVILTQMPIVKAPNATVVASATTAAMNVVAVDADTLKSDEGLATEDDNMLALSHPRPISRLDPKTQAMLKEYITEHIRYASTTTIVPTVRAVSYNASYNAESVFE